MNKGMIKAKIISLNLVVYIHEDLKPNMPHNSCKYVVSKQPNSRYIFCADKDDTIIL